MENSVQSPTSPLSAQQRQGGEGSASPRPPLNLSLSFKNLDTKRLERFLTARTHFETPDAERTELHKVFNTFDKDGDGKLSVEEIRVSLEKLGVIVAAADLASLLFAEPDVDLCEGNGFVEEANGHARDVQEHTCFVKDEHTGCVDFSAFYDLYRSLCQEENEEDVIYTPHGKISNSDLKLAFDLFDKNHDNYISVPELQSVLISLSFEEGNSLDECRSMIASVDSDGDGMVNFDEFKAMMKSIK